MSLWTNGPHTPQSIGSFTQSRRSFELCRTKCTTADAPSRSGARRHSAGLRGSRALPDKWCTFRATAPRAHPAAGSDQPPPEAADIGIPAWCAGSGGLDSAPDLGGKTARRKAAVLRLPFELRLAAAMMRAVGVIRRRRQTDFAAYRGLILNDRWGVIWPG